MKYDVKKICGYLCVLLFLAVCIWYWFGRASVPDNGNRVDDARTELNNAKAASDDAGKRAGDLDERLERNSGEVERVSEEVGSVSEGLSYSKESIGRVQDRLPKDQAGLRDCESIIDQDQAILKGIRARGPETH